MKRNLIKDLHTKTPDELKKMVRELRHDIAELQINLVIGKEKNTAQRKELGKDLARVLTVLGKQEKNMVQSGAVKKAEVVNAEKTETKEDKKSSK